MENPPPVQHDPDNPPPFWCHICKVACSSAINLQSHFLGARHKRAEEALQEGQDGEEQPKPLESLQEQFNACKNTEPVLGLEYIYEYQSHGYARYECRLCNCFLGRTHMFMHVIGNRHRILYLAEHHPSLNVNNTSVLNKRGKKLKKLRETCVKVEEEFGRKQINVVKEEDKTFASDEPTPAMPTQPHPPLPHCVGFKQEKVKTMDFTSDNFMDVEEEPAEEEEGVVTFQKLKAEYEAIQERRRKAREESLQTGTGGPVRGREGQPEKGQAGGLAKDQAGEPAKDQAGEPAKDQAGEPAKDQAGEPAKDQAGEPAKDQAGEPAKDQAGEPAKNHVDGPEKDQAGGPEKENETCNSDVDRAKRKPVLDAFSGPQEVFEYLQSFEVFELRHIHYLMKVTEKLKRVLDCHQKKVESATDAQDGDDEQPSADEETLAVSENEEGDVEPAEGFVSDPEDSVEEPDAETATEDNQAAELSAGQQEDKSPQPFLGIKSRRSNKKLSFRISGAPAEKKSLVSGELLSNMQYEFATKGKANKMAASVTSTDDADLSEDPAPLEPAMDSQDAQEPDEDSTVVTPTRDAYPHELLGNPSGSVNTRASNVPDPASSFTSRFDGTRDVQEERFPPSKPQPKHPMSNRPDRAGAAPFRGQLPNEGPAMGTSSRASHPHERLENPAGSVTNRASNERFKNVDFPPPKGPKTQERMRNPAPSYPPCDPIRTSADSDTNWSSNEGFDNFDDFPPPKAPNTQERVRNSASSYPPREPMRTSGRPGTTWASNEPFRNADDFPPPKAPNTQERVRNSGSSYPPRDTMRTSAGPGTTWASNEPFRNVDDFPPSKAPNTQEWMRNSASAYPPRDSMRTPAGSVSTWASNEPFRNVDDFPPSKAPNTQERVRNSGSSYPPRDPMRTSAGPGTTWASNEPFRNVDDFPPSKAPNTQEWMRNSASSYPPREPMRTPAGSVSTWASNEPFKNVGGFPPPSAPNTQERMRNSAPPYPPRDPMRTSAGPGATWASNEPYRNVDGFPPSKAPNTQEPLRNSAPPYPPRGPMGTSAGSVSTWASNEPFNNGGFPPPRAQHTQERMRNLAPPYPYQEPMRTSAGSGFPRAPGPHTTGYSGVRPPDSYRQMGNPVPARAPFPPAGPRASVPAFPNDEVTAKFFDSLKEMDISEVTATLNKITATNPAFRGINVPSLVRYLIDTGKIRPSGNRPGNV